MSPQLYAEVNIIDKDHLLQNLPVKNATPFAQAFQCNQPKDFFIQSGVCAISCDNVICMDKCSVVATPGQIQFEDCTADSVQMYSTKGHAISVLREDYEQSSHSMVLTLLKNINAFYQPINHIHIIAVRSVWGAKLIENGKMQNIPVTRILFEAYPQATVKADGTEAAFQLEIELDFNRVGFDQVMFVYPPTGFKNDGNYLIKRKGFIHVLF
ncbi:MAG: hypothetical protein H7235_04260 [Bdellovibrionaceae bacterium]|nr:hypothetical protein [Pseudobdellovibrionaceae bacterium]